MKSSKIKSFDKVEIKLELCRFNETNEILYIDLKTKTYPEWETFFPRQHPLISGKVARFSSLGVEGEDSPCR